MTVTTTYTSPLSATIDLAAGALVGETSWDAIASDLLHIAGTTGHIGARVYNDAAISVPNNSSTALTFNQERYDTDPNGAIHDNATNNNRLTCRTAGKYAIWGHIVWAGNATGIREIQIRVNGTSVIASQDTAALSVGMGMSVSTVWELAATDYVELLAYQNSGGALNATATSAFGPEFGMAKC